MDHMGFLGDTLSEIARVKGGIIKPGAMAVSTARGGGPEGSGGNLPGEKVGVPGSTKRRDPGCPV